AENTTVPLQFAGPRMQCLVLLVGDGQEDAIIHGQRTSEESGDVSPRNCCVSGIAAQGRPGRLRVGSRSIARPERNPGGLRRTVGSSEAGIADENLAESTVVPTR